MNNFLSFSIAPRFLELRSLKKMKKMKQKTNKNIVFRAFTFGTANRILFSLAFVRFTKTSTHSKVKQIGQTILLADSNNSSSSLNVVTGIGF